MSIDVDDGAFRAALPAAFREWRFQAFAVADVTADKVVEVAKRLVPKRSHRLEESIIRGPLVATGPDSAYVEVRAGGLGIRETIYVEFGTYKMRAQPFMRPALALAVGALKSGGAAARLSTTSRTRAAARRAAHRQRLRRAVKKGLLTREQARQASRRVSGAVRARR